MSCFLLIAKRAAVLVAAALPFCALGQTFRLRSPDGQTEAVAQPGSEPGSLQLRVLPAADGLRWTARLEGSLPAPSRWRQLGKPQSRTETVAWPFGRQPEIRARWTELRVACGGGRQLEIRLYDDALAYRWVLAAGDSVTLRDERADLLLPAAAELVSAVADTLLTSFESNIWPVAIDTAPAKHLRFSPTVVRSGGMRYALLESDVRQYPGLFWRPDAAQRTLVAVLPHVPRSETVKHFNRIPTANHPYVARVAGARSLPWRILQWAPSDAALAATAGQYVHLLGVPPQPGSDFSWVKPGPVVWDWWNALNWKGVPFQSGINTETYRYAIDFAARNGLPYVALDDGWSDPFNLLQPSGKLDMPALLAHGRRQNVGLFLWCVWHTLDRQLDAALDSFQRWGIAGVKVDFMDRSDQVAVDFYERVAAAAARRNLLVVFHGAFPQKGLSRRYPNVIAHEGVLGLEYNKWSDRVTPRHDAFLPFVRQLTGPMDYTPGAMRNATRENFRAVFARPMSQGTRAHQLALFVAYDHPLVMYADAPTHYEAEPQVLEFLRAVPSVWDESRVLQGEMGAWYLAARRKGGTWYLAGIAGDSARTAEVPLDFLPAGRSWQLQGWQDGPNATRHAEDATWVNRQVRSGESVAVPVAPGGGFVFRVQPANQ